MELLEKKYHFQKEFLNQHLGDSKDGKLLKELAFHSRFYTTTAINLMLKQRPELASEYQRLLETALISN